MHRTEGLYHAANSFTNGPPGTRVEEDWLNAVQEEICGVIEGADLTVLTPRTDTRAQLLAAIQAIALRSTAGGSGTRSTAGEVTVTGLGFEPKFVLLFAADATPGNMNGSVGIDDASNPMHIRYDDTGVRITTGSSDSLYVRRDSSNYLRASISAMSADGFVIDFDLTGAVSLTYTWFAIR